MMCNERASSCSTIERLQDRRFYLDKTMFIQVTTHGCDEATANDEDLPGLLAASNQIKVTLALAQFHILKPMILFWQRAQPLTQEAKLAHMQSAFTPLCREKVAAHLYKVAHIQQSKSIIGILSNIIDAEEDLNAPRTILDMSKSNFSLIAHRTNAPGKCKGTLRSLPFIKVF